MKTKSLDIMTQEELDAYSEGIETKRAEKALLMDCLSFANDDGILDQFDIPVKEFPHLSYRDITSTIRNWLNMNGYTYLSVKSFTKEGKVTIRKSGAPKDKYPEDWSPFVHREEFRDPDIFLRIDCGLKEDYIEPDTKHVWHIKDYLAGKTGNGVAVTFGKKFLGMAFRTVSEAHEYSHTRTFESVPHMEKMHKASSSNGSRRYY